jgi:hypothetical protein
MNGYCLIGRAALEKSLRTEGGFEAAESGSRVEQRFSAALEIAVDDAFGRCGT